MNLKERAKAAEATDAFRDLDDENDGADGAADGPEGANATGAGVTRQLLNTVESDSEDEGESTKKSAAKQ